MTPVQATNWQSHNTYRHARLSDGGKALQIEVVSITMVRLTAAPRELIQTFQAACKKSQINASEGLLPTGVVPSF